MKKYLFIFSILWLSLANAYAIDNFYVEGETYLKIENFSDHVLFVDADASTGGDGTSWGTAFKYLQDALVAVGADNSITEIWVADGVYYPDEDEAGNVMDNSEGASFKLQSNLSILGGFAGTETTIDQRDFATNVTILSGDIDKNDGTVNNILMDTDNIVGTNSTWVVNGTNLNNVVLDGFTITAGHANDGDFKGRGGGIFINNCSLTFTNLKLIGNKADRSGGGLMITNGRTNTNISNVLFYGNTAEDGGGMAIFCFCDPVIRNVTFANNTATDSGGAMHNLGDADVKIYNSIFYDNTAPTDNSIHNAPFCIFGCGYDANPIIQYCYFDDASLPAKSDNSSSNNRFSQADPFVDLANGNLQLVAFSKAIDAGNNALNSATLDLNGKPRRVDDQGVADTGSEDGPVIDLGAFEKQTSSGLLPMPANVLAVDADAALGGDGRSWDFAFKYLQDALALAATDPTITEIWVADGLYYPDEDEAGNVTNDLNTETFQLQNNLSILGGFSATESTSAERNPEVNISILSGDIDNNDTTTDNIVTDTDDIAGDNSLHVVTTSGTDVTAILDGFTITAGQADAASGPGRNGAGIYNSLGSPSLLNLNIIGNMAFDNGGGMYDEESSATLNHVIFSKNRAAVGGGIYCLNGNITLNKVDFLKNLAIINGGGMTSKFSAATLDNVNFTGNNALVFAGGLLISSGASTVLTNVGFSGNNAIDDGGAIYLTSSGNQLFNNVTFSKNSSSIRRGGAMYLTSSANPIINNSIFYGNTAAAGNTIFVEFGVADIRYSYLDDASLPVGSTGSNNFLGQVDPFVDANGADNIIGTADDNLQLADNSLAIDAGNNNINSTIEDLAGNARKVNDNGISDAGVGTDPIIDMGAFEKQTNSILPSNIRVVDAEASTGGDGIGWATAFKYLQDAIAAANADNTITEIWVADGVYYPDEDEGGNVTNNNIGATFTLKNNLSLLGGFAGTESQNTQRNPFTNSSILSGDIDGSDTNTDGIITDPNNIDGVNSRHVVTASNRNNTALLDGFTITAGNANATSGDNSYGGGFFADVGSPTLKRIRFIGNKAKLRGGGIYLEGENANIPAILENLSFYNNYSGFFGGGFYQVGGDFTLFNALFSGNQAEYHGGAIYNDGTSAAKYRNITFANNTALQFRGGAIYNFVADIDVKNSIFVGNTANVGDNNSIHNDGGNGGSSTTHGYNSFDEDIDLSSDRNKVGAGNNNTNISNPFVDIDGADNIVGTLDDNLQLVNFSDAIDAGSNSFNSTTQDIAGNPRNFDDTAVTDVGAGTAPIIDRGALERQAASESVLFVDADAPLGGNGSRWGEAFKYLQDALAAANADKTITEIWVAEGVYYPDEDEAGNVTNNNESATFQLLNNVSILGGFQGTESSGDERNMAAYVTILSGDIDLNDTNLDGNHIAEETSHVMGNNSFHVVNGSNTDATAILDGFTITAGQADGSGFNDNNGAGIFNSFGAPSLFNLNIIGNIAVNDGGGMFNGFLSPTLTNLSFSKNVAVDGGGMFNISSAAILTNITFSLNEAENGGGIYNFAATPNIRNSIFFGNTASSSGNSINNNGIGTPVISFSYFDDPSLPAGSSGNNNLLGQANPFIDAANGDLQLIDNSRAIDAGNSNFNSTSKDLANNSRNYNDFNVTDTGSGDNPIIDMGAFERSSDSKLIPDVSNLADLTYCSGKTTSEINFAGTVGNTLFAWTNDNLNIGLAASGKGAIGSFTVTNSTTSSITATISVTPYTVGSNGVDDSGTGDDCVGTTQSFTIMVLPTPDVVVPSDMAYCNGMSTAPISFSGNVTGTLFSWTNDNTNISLAASGIASIPSFTATNATLNTISATISVLPYTVGPNGVDDNGVGDDCVGTVQTFRITVFNNAACATSCTSNELILDENSTEEGIFQAIETITSNRIIAENTAVVFKANTSITLQAGFHATTGSNFTALIEACPVTLVASETRGKQAKIIEQVVDRSPKVNIFPNPTQSQTNIVIELATSQEVQLDIYNLNGQRVMTMLPKTPLLAGKHRFNWACHRLEAGIYITVMNGRQVSKLVVLH